MLCEEGLGVFTDCRVEKILSTLGFVIVSHNDSSIYKNKIGIASNIGLLLYFDEYKSILH